MGNERLRCAISCIAMAMCLVQSHGRVSRRLQQVGSPSHTLQVFLLCAAVQIHGIAGISGASAPVPPEAIEAPAIMHAPLGAVTTP